MLSREATCSCCSKRKKRKKRPIMLFLVHIKKNKKVCFETMVK